MIEKKDIIFVSIGIGIMIGSLVTTLPFPILFLYSIGVGLSFGGMIRIVNNLIKKLVKK